MNDDSQSSQVLLEKDGISIAAPGLTRRAVLGMFGAAGVAVLTGCGGGGSAGTSAGTTSTTGTTTTTGTTAHAVTPEGEIGPYFADDSAAGFLRSSVLSNLDGTDTQSGVSLTLKVYVYDTENDYAAVEGSQVDIWSCNATGVYSDISRENTSIDTYLRGYQLTDADGLATFKTIIPGWYEGRTTHIHLRVRSKYSEASSTSDGSNTTQLFFNQTLINEIYTTVSPYNTHGTDTTTNAEDRVYTQQTEGETLLTLVGSISAGYTTATAVYLPITAI